VIFFFIKLLEGEKGVKGAKARKQDIYHFTIYYLPLKNAAKLLTSNFKAKASRLTKQHPSGRGVKKNVE
jgi:hypothetical protein